MWSASVASSRRRECPRRRLRAGGTTVRRVLPLAAALVMVGAEPATAQGGPPLQAQGMRDLTFGDLLGGLARWIPPSDPTSSAQFRIQGRGGTEILVSFFLPAALTGPEGAALPLTFGPMDGGLSYSGNVTDQLPFDPRSPFLLTLPAGQGTQRAWLFLGGTANPPGLAALGAYSGTVVLTLAIVTN